MEHRAYPFTPSGLPVSGGSVRGPGRLSASPGYVIRRSLRRSLGDDGDGNNGDNAIDDGNNDGGDGSDDRSGVVAMEDEKTAPVIGPQGPIGDEPSGVRVTLPDAADGDGDPVTPPPYTQLDPAQSAVGMQDVPWHSGPGRTPKPRTTPTSQVDADGNVKIGVQANPLQHATPPD